MVIMQSSYSTLHTIAEGLSGLHAIRVVLVTDGRDSLVLLGPQILYKLSPLNLPKSPTSRGVGRAVA